LERDAACDRSITRRGVGVTATLVVAQEDFADAAIIEAGNGRGVFEAGAFQREGFRWAAGSEGDGARSWRCRLAHRRCAFQISQPEPQGCGGDRLRCDLRRRLAPSPCNDLGGIGRFVTVPAR
jgi:hypothetical protein